MKTLSRSKRPGPRTRIVVSIASLLVTCIFSPLSAAQDVNPELTDTFNIRVGAFYGEPDGKFGVEIPPLPEVGIDFKDIGLDDNDWNGYASFGWRFGEKWGLVLEYAAVDTDGNLTAFREVELPGDEVIPVGAALDSNLKTDFYTLRFTRSFIRDDRKEVGVFAGLTYADLEASVSASILVDDVLATFGPAKAEIDAPLPSLGVYGIYGFTPRLSATGHLGWVGAEIGDYSGQIWTGLAALDFRVTRNLGLGIGYTLFNVDIDEDKNDEKVSFDYDLNGVAAYLTWGF